LTFDLEWITIKGTLRVWLARQTDELEEIKGRETQTETALREK
jgi:hypothetical protein